ncbi:MAG: energy transducer TonB [Luteimonas sp.]
MSIGDRDGRRWAISLAVVLGVHATGVATAVWWAQHAPMLIDASPMEAVMVELAPEPEAPPAPPTELPPGPPQQEQHRPEPVPRPRPEPRAEAPPLEDPEVQDPYRQQEPPEPDRDRPSDEANVAQTLAPPNVDARHGDRYAAQQTVSGATGQAVATWQGRLLGHLEQYRRYPRQAARRRMEGVTHVRFTVDRQGNVSDPHIGRSSGHDLLDEETLATVRRASPVPPPPPDIPGDPVDVMVPVDFFLGRR